MRGRYYGKRAWRDLAAACLRRDPVCRAPGCDRPSRHADHIVPRSEGGADSLANLRGLCEQCHNARTARGNGELRRVSGCDARGLPTDPADPWWQP